MSMPLSRRTVRLAAAAVAAVMATIYFGIGLRVLDVGGSESDKAFLWVFGSLAGGAFLLGAVLLARFDRRWLWILGAAFQVFVYWAYIDVARNRNPPFEMWGITLRIIQVPLLVALVYLAARPGPADRTALAGGGRARRVARDVAGDRRLSMGTDRYQATGERERTPFLPPRWFIRVAWVAHRALYRVTGGRVGLGRPTPTSWGTMRLRTIGRRTGAERTAILGYYEDGPNLVTLAMNGWGESEPAWWLNLMARPDAVVDLVDGPRAVRARAADGEERARLWARWRDVGDDVDAYARLRPSETAVVVLEPRPEQRA